MIESVERDAALQRWELNMKNSEGTITQVVITDDDMKKVFSAFLRSIIVPINEDKVCVTIKYA